MVQTFPWKVSGNFEREPLEIPGGNQIVGRGGSGIPIYLKRKTHYAPNYPSDSCGIPKFGKAWYTLCP